MISQGQFVRWCPIYVIGTIEMKAHHKRDSKPSIDYRGCRLSPQSSHRHVLQRMSPLSHSKTLALNAALDTLGGAGLRCVVYEWPLSELSCHAFTNRQIMGFTQGKQTLLGAIGRRVE